MAHDPPKMTLGPHLLLSGAHQDTGDLDSRRHRPQRAPGSVAPSPASQMSEESRSRQRLENAVIVSFKESGALRLAQSGI